jgi:hypothetical protein
MKPFVFIFRQSKHPLTEEQQKQRADAVRTWAIRLRDEGHTLEPHLLGEEKFVAAPEGGSTAQDNGDPITAILVVDFASFDEAKKAAEAHPGRHYGVSIEVREAFPPPAAAPAPAR